MKHYIDKSALVAEIERRINEINLDSIEDWRYRLQREHDIEVMKDILSLIDTLEVKEVDLENYVKGRIDYPLIGVDFPNIYPNYKELKDYCDRNGIKDEDKVKIIIIKDDIL